MTSYLQSRTHSSRTSVTLLREDGCETSTLEKGNFSIERKWCSGWTDTADQRKQGSQPDINIFQFIQFWTPGLKLTPDLSVKVPNLIAPILKRSHTSSSALGESAASAIVLFQVTLCIVFSDKFFQRILTSSDDISWYCTLCNGKPLVNTLYMYVISFSIQDPKILCSQDKYTVLNGQYIAVLSVAKVHVHIWCSEDQWSLNHLYSSKRSC